MYIKLPKRIEAAVLNFIGYDPIYHDEEEIEESDSVIGSNITQKTLKDVEDDWVKSYIIN